MSNINQSKIIKNGLDHTFEQKCEEIRESSVRNGLSNLKSRIKDMDLKIESEDPASKPEPKLRYENTQLADVARKIYRDKVNPLEKKDKPEPFETPDTQASRAHMRAMANALAGMRSNGGDSGKLAPTAGPNGGSTGTPGCGNYYALTTSMSLEEYEDYINKKFMGEEVEEEEEEVVTELLTEKDTAVSELEGEILKLEDISWQSIDKVMRRIADDHDITPKELHKSFKSEHDGMIPDDWAKEQQVAEQVGWFPLDEAFRMHDKIGNVYEVSFIFRGGTQRLKFFWPEVGTPTRKQMEETVKKFWPGARLLAYYVSMHPGDDVKNSMVVIPAMTENFEVVPTDLWDFMSEEDTEIYDEIAAEEGEPVSPVFMTEDGDGYEMIIEDHDTGEEKLVVFGEGKRGLWDNIHAKRKRGESPAKKGDKDYPETLNVEEKNPCWTGYKRKKGTKKFADGSCVKEADMTGAPSIKDAKPSKKTNVKYDKHMGVHAPTIKEGDEMKGLTQKGGHKRSAESGAGLTQKGVDAVNRKTGGNLKTAVTTPPSKLKAGSKAAGRRKSFCARSRSWNGERGKAARARWNC